MNPVKLCEILSSARFDLSNEKACQAEVDVWLHAHCPPETIIEREFRLCSRDVPDFMVGSTAIEVKMNGAQPAAIIRQLIRYAAHPAVEALILLTNRAIGLPPSIGGKPVHQLSLGRAWL